MSPKTSVRVSTLLVGGVLALQPAFAQGRGGAGTTSTGTSGSGAPSTGTTGTTGSGIPTTRPTIPNPTTTQPQPTNQPQPVFISGQVVMEDGSAVPSGIVIERVCGAQTRAEGYTDGKGYFMLQLGQQNTGITPDASEEGRGFGNGGAGMGSIDGMPQSGGNALGGTAMQSEMRFANCDLRARAAGFRSQTVSLANHRAMDSPDIGVILLHRLGPSEGNTVSTASLRIPKEARKSFEKGMEALKKKKLEEAEKDYLKAADIYPQYAQAWCELGRLQLQRGDKAGARKSFDTAVQADPKFVDPFLEIAYMEFQSQRWQELSDVSDTVVKMNSFDYPQVYYFRAVANYFMKNLAVAEANALRAEKLDTRHIVPKASALLGVLLVQKSDYTGAAEHFRAYLKAAPEADDAAKVKAQIEQLEKISASAKAGQDQNL